MVRYEDNSLLGALPANVLIIPLLQCILPLEDGVQYGNPKGQVEFQSLYPKDVRSFKSSSELYRV